MRVAYRIVLSEADNGYVVYVPDFEIGTEGRDIADALYMARDAIGMMGITLEDEGLVIPSPGKNNEYLSVNDEFELYVDVDFIEYRKKHDNRKIKKTLTIPSWLNKAAEAEHINFSRTLEEALIAKLG